MTRFSSSMVIFFFLLLSFAFCGCDDPCQSFDRSSTTYSTLSSPYLRQTREESACLNFVRKKMTVSERNAYFCNQNFQGNAAEYSRLGCAEIRRDAFAKSGNAWKRECRITDDKKAVISDNVIDGLFAEKSLDDDGNEIVTISFEYHLDPDAYDEYKYASQFVLSQYSEKKNRYVDIPCDETYKTVNGKLHDNYIDKFSSDDKVRTVCVIHSDMKAGEFNPLRYGMGEITFRPFRGNDHDWKCDTL